MKTRRISWIVLFALMALPLIVFYGCDDDHDDDIIDEKLPALTTTEVTAITRYSAVSGGNIYYDGGGFTITARGVVWGLDENPTLENSQGYTTDGDGVGDFVSNIFNLETGNHYHIRAYATNINGTGYGNNLSFETPEVLYGNGVTDIDNNFYTTVIIGNQEWMAENLRVTRYNNEDAIPTGLSDAEWENTTEGAYIIISHVSIDGLNSDTEVVAAYGKHYNWHTVSDPRGVCPEGWTVPSDDDWTQLVDYIMDEYDYHNEWGSEDINGVGNALKSCRQVDSPLGEECNTSTHPRWNEDDWSDYNHHGFDEFGFSAFPSGFHYYSEEIFGGVGFLSIWWAATELSHGFAWFSSLDAMEGNMTIGSSALAGIKNNGLSLRCFKSIEQ